MTHNTYLDRPGEECSGPLPPVKVGIKIVFRFSKVISSWSNLVKISVADAERREKQNCAVWQTEKWEPETGRQELNHCCSQQLLAWTTGLTRTLTSVIHILYRSVNYISGYNVIRISLE